MEDRSLPVPSVRTVFLDTGEEVAEYGGSPFGLQPEWDKKDIIGAGLIFRSLSTETFHQEGSAFPPARSILYNVVDANIRGTPYKDERDQEPWGMLFSDCGDEDSRTSTIITQVRQEFRRNGGRPFLTSIDYVDKGNGMGYYTLKRYMRVVSPKAEVSTQNRQTKN